MCIILLRSGRMDGIFLIFILPQSNTGIGLPKKQFVLTQTPFKVTSSLIQQDQVANIYSRKIIHLTQIMQLNLFKGYTFVQKVIIQAFGSLPMTILFFYYLHAIKERAMHSTLYFRFYHDGLTTSDNAMVLVRRRFVHQA